MQPSAPQPSPTGDEALYDGLHAFALLDAAGAIALMDASMDLYLEIAQAYRHELSGLVSHMDAAFDKANLSEASRTLHTFKGLSLTVGAQRMSEVCKRCELLLKPTSSDARGPDPATRTAIAAVLLENGQSTGNAFDAFFEQQTQPSLHHAASPNDSAKQSALIHSLQDLCQLLAQSDLAALDRFAALLEQHSEVATQLEKLGPPLRAFDFAQAMVQCNNLIRKLGPHP
jgi:HPt (histidine-containing phosphotransfer) domain-containing protein